MIGPDLDTSVVPGDNLNGNPVLDLGPAGVNGVREFVWVINEPAGGFNPAPHTKHIKIPGRFKSRYQG